MCRRSIRRPQLLFLAVWIGIVALFVGLMVSLPQDYRVAATLQAQRNQVVQRR